MADDVKFKGIAITDDDRQFVKDFGKELGNYAINIPLPFQKSQIFAACSRAIGGADVKSLPPTDYEYIRMIITLNTVIIDSPPWWNGADNCPDDDFLFELWRWYLDCEKEFAARLKRKTQGKNLEATK